MSVVKPDNPYLFVGEDLVLFCNLTKLELEEDSRFLFFTRDGTEIPASFVEVLTTRSVRLRYPIKVPHNEGHFVCWLRQQKDNFKTIGSQRVQADCEYTAVVWPPQLRGRVGVRVGVGGRGESLVTCL